MRTVSQPIYQLAVLVALLSLTALAGGWALCLFGTSDDGLHCVPAILGTVVAGPLGIVSAIGAWAMRRRIKARGRW